MRRENGTILIINLRAIGYPDGRQTFLAEAGNLVLGTSEELHQIFRRPEWSDGGMVGSAVVVICLRLLSTQGRESGLPAREGVASRQKIRSRRSIAVDGGIKIDTLIHVASPDQNIHRGNDFSEFLTDEGIRAEVEILALKRTLALQLQQILEQEHITKTELATRMKTSRASLDRILDPANPSLTVASLGKAAAALGRKVELRFVPA